jgi:hypothetical protein
MCRECNALWVDVEPAGKNFEDYSTYMRGHGVAEPDTPAEIELLGPTSGLRQTTSTDFLGSITDVDLSRWTQLIAGHPHLVPMSAREGLHPFTGASVRYRVHAGDARVVVGGVPVGRMTWATDGSNRIVVDGDATLVEPIALEIASELGGVYRRGG